MKLLFLVAAGLTIAGAELHTQQRPDSASPQARHLDSLVRFAGGDTAAIRRVAVDSGWRITSVQSFNRVGDTAWMTFTRTRECTVGSYGGSESVLGSTARVERHNGRWVRVPKPQPPEPCGALRFQRPKAVPRPAIVDSGAVWQAAALSVAGSLQLSRPPAGLRVIGDTGWVEAQGRTIRVEWYRGVWMPTDFAEAKRRAETAPFPSLATVNPTPAQVAYVIQRVLVMGASEQLIEYRAAGDTVWATVESPNDDWQGDPVRVREIRLEPLNAQPLVPRSSASFVRHPVMRSLSNVDTAPILRIATDTGVRVIGVTFIVGDTAWVAVEWRGRQTAVRVERRNGQWMKVR